MSGSARLMSDLVEKYGGLEFLVMNVLAGNLTTARELLSLNKHERFMGVILARNASRHPWIRQSYCSLVR